VNAAQDSAELQAQFKTQGIEVVRAGPSNYAALIRSETDKWARVIKAAGVQSQ
jgi:tripartite-type tricarboxylate transporter receptor subunit TctC